MGMPTRNKTFSVLFFVVGVFVLAACHPNSAGLNSVKPTNATQDVQCAPGVDCGQTSTDQTNQSVCAQTPGVAPTLAGVWVHKRAYNDGHTVVSSYQISQASATLTVQNNCTQEGLNLNETASTRIALAPNVFHAQSAAYKSEDLRLPSGKTMTCKANIMAGTYNYKFHGRCLILNGVGPQKSSLVLVPSI